MTLSQSPIRSRSCLIAGLLLIVGCGVDAYQERLNKTKDYYNFLEKVELNLEPKWADGRIVDYLRVPKKFQPIPAPVPVKTEDGKEEMPAVDPRQPDFLNLVFPTQDLVGAWDASFEVPVADGSMESRKAYIYVLSNYWIFTDQEAADALKFTGSMIQLISEALEEQLPKEKLESPDVEMHPKPGGYLPAATYSVFNYKPKPITLNGSTVPYTFTVYARQNGNIQCLILVATPENTSSKDKVVERVAMMLEHFTFTRNEPKPGQTQSSPAPSGGTSGF